MPQYNDWGKFFLVARPNRLERLTYCLEGSCSIRLSYGRVAGLIISRSFPIAREKIQLSVQSVIKSLGNVAWKDLGKFFQ